MNHTIGLFITYLIIILHFCVLSLYLYLFATGILSIPFFLMPHCVVYGNVIKFARETFALRRLHLICNIA